MECLSATRKVFFRCMVQHFFVEKRRKKLGPCIKSINQNRLNEWVWLGEFWKHISINRESIHWNLVGNCATCIVRSFSFVFFIDFCSFFVFLNFFSCCVLLLEKENIYKWRETDIDCEEKCKVVTRNAFQFKWF